MIPTPIAEAVARAYGHYQPVLSFPAWMLFRFQRDRHGQTVPVLDLSQPPGSWLFEDRRV